MNLSNLHPISTYAIVLRANTTAGNGPWTNWYTVTTDEDCKSNTFGFEFAAVSINLCFPINRV